MTKPKPIGPDPRAGQFQVVVSFRAQPCAGWTRGGFEDMVRQHTEFIAKMCDQFGDLDVAVREIGQQGEASRFEGEWPPSQQAAAAPSDGPGRPKGVR